MAPTENVILNKQWMTEYIISMCILLFLEFLAVPDTCLLENGGCEHFCDEDEGGRRLNCSCADGYFLDVDGRSCVAEGEFV